MRFAPEAQVYHQHAQSWPGYFRTKMGRGFWRIMVYRRYPGKALKDSYTPQVLKLQILLAPLALVGLVWALWRRQPGQLALAAPFLLTTLPFTRFAAQRDPLVAAVAPWGLWLRSLAFAAGVVRGLLASPHPAGPAIEHHPLRSTAGQSRRDQPGRTPATLIMRANEREVIVQTLFQRSITRELTMDTVPQRRGLSLALRTTLVAALAVTLLAACNAGEAPGPVEPWPTPAAVQPAPTTGDMRTRSTRWCRPPCPPIRRQRRQHRSPVRR